MDCVNIIIFYLYWKKKLPENKMSCASTEDQVL